MFARFLLFLTFLTAAAAQRSAVSLGSQLQTHTSASSEDDAAIIRDDHIEALGGLDKVDLAFEGLALSIDMGKKKGTKDILDGSIRGRARPGRLMAIMGPSGAGKSSVLHALAGRIKKNSALKLFGRRYINGKELSGDSMLPAAFIEQEVNFFPHMTVRETLDFRVQLSLGSRLSENARKACVEDLMDQLGLTKAADTIVGNSKVRGISGGERKRLSIAVEMIAAPSLIFLDEPTSGLDATAATKLVQTLRDLADDGKTVVAVIHQPSQHVFSQFDDVLLVSEGKLMYFGPREEVREYMNRHSCVASAETGTAEHILDCISSDLIGEESEEEAKARLERLSLDATRLPIDMGAKYSSKDGKNKLQSFDSGIQRGPRASIFTQFRLLLKRSFKEITRGKLLLFIKLMQQLTTALIYGGIYNLGTNQASIQDRYGLLSLIAIGSANMAVAQSIRAFPREKAIVAPELASRMYRTLPYFVGKALSEIPVISLMSSIFGGIVYRLTGLSRAAGKFRNFLSLLCMHGIASEATGLLVGALSPSSDVALAIFPAILVINIIFDGKNISEENTPRLLKWVPKVGLIRWGFEGLCINEFQGLEFDASGQRRGPVAKTGTDALARFGLGSRTIGDVLRAQMIITAAFYGLSYLGLTLTKQRFEVMKPPTRK